MKSYPVLKIAGYGRGSQSRYSGSFPAHTHSFGELVLVNNSKSR